MEAKILLGGQLRHGRPLEHTKQSTEYRRLVVQLLGVQLGLEHRQRELDCSHKPEHR